MIVEISHPFRYFGCVLRSMLSELFERRWGHEFLSGKSLFVCVHCKTIWRMDKNNADRQKQSC